MTRCQLKLRHSVTSLAQTLDYIEVTHGRLGVGWTQNRLVLKMIAHKAVTYLTTMMNEVTTHNYSPWCDIWCRWICNWHLHGVLACSGCTKWHWKCVKVVGGCGSAPDPSVVDCDTRPNPLVSWGGDTPTPHPIGSTWSKPQNCRWNFYTSYHSSRDISISGLGGHISISGSRSLPQSFGNTSFDVAVVRKLDFVTWITAILILDLLCQHDHEISPVSKKITHVAFCTSYSGKVTKGQSLTLNWILYWFKSGLNISISVVLLFSLSYTVYRLWRQSIIYRQLLKTACYGGETPLARPFTPLPPSILLHRKLPNESGQSSAAE